MSITGRGFQVEYPAITLHAVSRGERPSIYCQLDDSISEPSTPDETISELRELSIIPQNPESRTFSPMSCFQTTHQPIPIRITQWIPYLRHCLNAPPFTRMRLLQTMRMALTMLLSILQTLKHSLVTENRNSVKLGGCAAISPMIADMRPTRSCSHHFFFWLLP